MKEFLKSRRFKILIASVLILLGIMLLSLGEVIASVFGFLSTPMQQGSQSLTAAAAQVGPGQKTAAEYEAEIARLTEERDKAIAIAIDYYDIKKKNEQYSKYLELKEQNPDFTFAPGSVVARGSLDNFYSFTLDVGSIVGVKKNDPVITNSATQDGELTVGGLVGYVSEVYPTYCKVTTILSPDANVSAVDVMARETGKTTADYGVVSGNIRLADQGLCRMGFITAQNKMEEGDIVTTSGISGMYPKGLQIGTVKELKTDELDGSLYALITPFVDIPNITDAMVITGFQGQGTMVVGNESSSEGGE